MLEHERKARQVKEKELAAEKEAEKPEVKKKQGNDSKLPSYCKSLDQIVKLELLEKESPEKISEIWNSYHSGRDAVSASLDANIYSNLHEKGKQFPMVFLNSCSLFCHCRVMMGMSYISCSSKDIRYTLRLYWNIRPTEKMPDHRFL